MFAPEDSVLMQQSWVRLLEKYRVDSSQSLPAFGVLAAAYGSADRHYHNLEHLDEMFRVAGRLITITDDPKTIQLAIWFHDAVYDSRAKDNEARSAELAIALLGPIGVPRSELERLVQLIHATAHSANAHPPGTRETAILLDADLAILGSPPDRYRRYAHDIRKEYAWVPEVDYRRHRAKVLEHFLARPRIFRTDILHDECEDRARENLRAELARCAR